MSAPTEATALDGGPYADVPAADAARAWLTTASEHASDQAFGSSEAAARVGIGWALLAIAEVGAATLAAQAPPATEPHPGEPHSPVAVARIVNRRVERTWVCSTCHQPVAKP